MKTYDVSPKAIVFCLALALFFLHMSVCYAGVFWLAPVVTDSMVLQQQSDVPFWGRGTPGTEIKLKASWGKSAATHVNPDSTWMLKLRSPKAGGPFELVIAYDDTSLTVKNILAGEVWLCSGQSNMEMPLMGWPPGDTILNSSQEIARSSLPNIRFFSIRRSFSPVVRTTCDGAWVQSSPSTSRDFSATAYFFGKKLYEALKVPIGLIHSSWGGTPVESWISAQYLSQVSQYDTTLQKIRESADGYSRIMDWLHQYPRIDMRSRKGDGRWKGLSFHDEECPSRAYNDSAWRVMRLPTQWERTEMGDFDGIVWFRKQVTIPREWIHKDLVLELGPIDDIDATFVNGTKVGGHEGEGMWKMDRVYNVAGGIIDSSLVQIAVRVTDYQGGGGLFGEPTSMVLHPAQSRESVALAGDWKYVPVAELMENALYVFGPGGRHYEKKPRLAINLSANTPTTLYNAMISPLLPYPIRGAIWYQGESNTGNPKLYKKLLPLLIENWRNDFKVGDFPFYYVQIAPFDYGAMTKSQLLREAQTATLSVKNTGMAVTLDIGLAENIHPPNKEDVGGRLAAWALAKTYKKNVPYSGPLYKAMKKQKGSIELTFDHAGKGLVLTGGVFGNNFQVAGADHVFKNVPAGSLMIRGNKLIISHPDIASPEAVRYAFTNTSGATLYNVDGLPAPSFRTDDWE